MKKVCIINSGCGSHRDIFLRIIKSLEEEYTTTKFPDEADLIINYLCGFTENQLAKIFEKMLYLKKLKKENAILIVCGCATRMYNPEIFEAMEFVDYVIKSDKDIVQEVADILNIEASRDYFVEINSGVLLLNIIGGCAKVGGFCNFCKQHYLKKPAKSAFTIEEICKIVARYKKPVLCLTGLNTCCYGKDFGDGKPKLHLLLKALSKIPTLKYIKIDGVSSSGIYEELCEEIEHNEKVVCVQFFLQSGSNHMLLEMNIGSKVEDNLVIINRFKGKAIESGIIVGHPGETEEDIQKTIKFIIDNNLWYVNVMEFMSSSGTPSHDMEQLPEEVYQSHCDAINRVVSELAHSNLDEIANNGVVGYVDKISPYEDNYLIEIRPFDFEGLCYTILDNVPLNLGDKVKLLELEVTDYEKHMFRAQQLEVLE